MNKSFKLVIFLFLSSLFLVTCKQKAKEGACVHEDAFIHLNVVDNLGVKVHNATVNIFDSEENYERARSDKNNSSYAIATYASDSSQAIEIPVGPYTDHWILVTVYDSTQLKFLSSELNSSQLDKLQSCSDYYLTVNIEPVGATVAFWTPASLNLPITIKFNGLVDTLTGFSSVPPTSPAVPGQPNQLNFPVKAGTYQYQATSKDGCTWQGEVEVKDGEFKEVKLEVCQRAVLAFYVNAAAGVDNAKFPIAIYVDNYSTPVGVLNDIHTGTVLNSCPGSPAADNVLYVYLEPGVTHFFKAVSQTGATSPCIWQGTTPVVDINCTSNTPIVLWSGCN